MDYDYMELGHLVPFGDDWWQDVTTGHMYRLDEEGRIRDTFGNVVREVFNDEGESDD